MELFDMTTISATPCEPRIVFLSGSKIDLVIIEKRDARTLTTYMNDPEVNRYLLRYMPLHVQEEETWIQSMTERKNGLVLGIVRKEETTLIGTTSLGWKKDNRDRTASFGLMIGDKNAWGKGYGTEATSCMLAYAFNTADLRGVELCLYSSNTAAKKVYEKCGFVEVGRIPHWLYLSPGVYDAEVMMVCMRP
jgi:RimJ/RimL family protein N-acetyltransferase